MFGQTLFFDCFHDLYIVHFDFECNMFPSINVSKVIVVSYIKVVLENNTDNPRPCSAYTHSMLSEFVCRTNMLVNILRFPFAHVKHIACWASGMIGRHITLLTFFACSRAAACMSFGTMVG